MPDEAVSLIKAAEVRAHAEMCGVSYIGRKGPRLEVRFSENTRFSAYCAVMVKAEFGDALTIMSGRSTSISLYAGNSVHTNSIKRHRTSGALDSDLDKVLALMRTLRDAVDTEQSSAGSQS